MNLRLLFIFSLLIGHFQGYSQCLISDFSVNIGPCTGEDLYHINGTITFSNEPLTGTLTVTVNDGITIYDTIINAPFTSAETFSISNLSANSQPLTIEAAFSDATSCTASMTSTAPESCTCVVSAGTFTSEIVGNSVDPTILTWEDQLTIQSNNDYLYFHEYGAIGGFDPGMYYLMYKCPPTTSDLATSDPCLLGVSGSSIDFSDVNNSSSVFYTVVDQLTDNIIYYVAVPAYSISNGIVAISINGSDWCYDYGEVFAIQYLDSISAPYTMNVLAGTVDFTLSGALPVLNGSNFTLSELSPATASLTTSSVANDGTFSITGLAEGETFSVKITDDAGSTKIVSNQLLILEENSLSNIEVYPNPFNQVISFYGISEPTTFHLIDNHGKIVESGIVYKNEELNSKDLKPGFYVLKLTTQHAQKHVKLIKQ